MVKNVKQKDQSLPHICSWSNAIHKLFKTILVFMVRILWLLIKALFFRLEVLASKSTCPTVLPYTPITALPGVITAVRCYTAFTGKALNARLAILTCIKGARTMLLITAVLMPVSWQISSTIWAWHHIN